MLAIPSIAASGYVVNLKFRYLGDPPEGRAKYDAIAGLPSRLFNLRALNTPSPLIVLTEGELDALMVEQLGFPAVGVAGANAFKDHHPRVLENYDEVVLIRDPDAAGAALVKKLMTTDLPLRVIEPPGGGDVNEAVLAGHGDALVAAIKGES